MINIKKEARSRANKKYRQKPEVKKANTIAVKKWQAANRESWKGFYPPVMQCECCGSDIYFLSGNPKTSIHFDHRHGGTEAIKGHPYMFFRLYKRTPAKELIWNSCDFGKLCSNCNRALPTVNRKLFLENITKYINKNGK